MINDRIDRNRRLAGLTVPDNQLTLTTTDRNHGVDRLDAGLQRLSDGLPRIHTGSHHLDPGMMRGLDRPLAVDRLTDGIDDTTDERFADRNFRDATGTLDRVTFLDADVVTHQHGADIVFFQVERDAIESTGELQHLSGHGPIQTVDLGNTVADLNDRARFLDIDLLVEAFDFFLDDRTDFFGPDLHDDSFYSRVNATCRSRKRPWTVLSTTVLPMRICSPAR